MAQFDFEKMQTLQAELQKKHEGKWSPIGPESARAKLLYMFIELGEMADVVKKNGDAAIMLDAGTRQHFIEEMCDSLMYLNDIMLCYRISPQELEEAYLTKYEKNMSRW